MDLLRLGNYVLHNGSKSRYKICCDVFSDSDWNVAATLIRAIVGPFRSVEGIPNGGTKLEEILKHYVDDRKEGPHLVVDDVYTSGQSMETAKDLYKTKFDTLNYCVAGAVLFSRGPAPYWISPVFQLNRILFDF